MNRPAIIKLLFLAFIAIISCMHIFAQDSIRTIHVFVALCDNANQGIVPVPTKIGNGQDPFNNLYWGAGFGVKTFFDKKSTEWKLVKTIKNPKKNILERVVFKHVSKNAYIVADAWDGANIKECTEAFLHATAGENHETLTVDSIQIGFGGSANLIAYTGHDGLMDFNLDLDLKPADAKKRDVIILACYSKGYFGTFIKQSGAYPLVWSTHLMSPEAYTLKAAIDGWLVNEKPEQVRERAAQAYNQYQHCGINGSRNLLRTGW